MEIQQLSATIRTKIGTCPICGTSWKGRRFFYIYQQWMKEHHEPFTIKQLREHVRQKHPMANQSRLLHDETTNDYICPDCSTRFQIKQDEKHS